MPISSRTLAGVVTLLLVAVTADGARGETVAESMARWGLIGTWAMDCSRPPSRSNVHLSYVARGEGRVFHERNFGGQRDSSREIRAASLKPGGLIELVADFGTIVGTRKWTMMKGADGRIRTLANSKVDGTDATVRDGRLVAGGAETGWQTRCPARSKVLREVRALCRAPAPGMRCPGGVRPRPPAIDGRGPPDMVAGPWNAVAFRNPA